MADQDVTAVRYVVLHHEGVAVPHYDLMFEREPGGALTTYRSPAWPITVRTRIEPLEDHRREYLEFEGPVSGDRGHVRRVLGGSCDVHLEAPFYTSIILLTPTRTALRINNPTEPVACSIEPAGWTGAATDQQ